MASQISGRANIAYSCQFRRIRNPSPTADLAVRVRL